MTHFSMFLLRFTNSKSHHSPATAATDTTFRPSPRRWLRRDAHAGRRARRQQRLSVVPHQAVRHPVHVLRLLTCATCTDTAIRGASRHRRGRRVHPARHTRCRRAQGFAISFIRDPSIIVVHPQPQLQEIRYAQGSRQLGDDSNQAKMGGASLDKDPAGARLRGLGQRCASTSPTSRAAI